MKVLVVPTWYPSGEDKLMGIYHKEFTCALNKYEIKADILYVDRQRLTKPFKYLFMKKKVVEKEDNYDVYKYRMLNINAISYHLQMKSYVRKFNKGLDDYIKKNGKPDVIHAMVSIPAGYAACNNKYNIPVVITEHSSNMEAMYENPENKKYIDYTLKHATMSTVSNFMREFVLKYTDYCAVIPNQVDTEIFKNKIERKIEDDFKLVSVCALREGKNLDVAFKAIKILIDGGLNITYTIIGDGFKSEFYKNAAKEIGVEDYVEFVGRKDKKDIPKYLEEAYALVIASDKETFAIPGIEALASGIPVVSTKCLGPEEFIDEECGRLAEVGNPESLARAIKEVYNNYSSFKKAHLEEVADRFSEKRVVETARIEYEKLIKR